LGNRISKPCGIEEGICGCKDHAERITLAMMAEQSENGFGAYDGYRIESNDELAVPPSHTTLEDSLSQSLLKLSITDRTAVEEEIHGVRCLGVTKETPDLLQRSLAEFNRELLTIKNSSHRITSLQNKIKSYEQLKRSSKTNGRANGPPIDVLRNVIDTAIDAATNTGTTNAAAKHECYLNDADVRLRFLRCENFDAKAAAKRFVNFFELALEVFGDFVADRPMRLTDFMETQKGGGRLKRYQLHAKKAFGNSKIQYMPFRDRSGRRVKVGVGGCNSELDLFLRIKINMLLDWIACEDVETQRKGSVIIVWPFNPPDTNTPSSINGSGTSSCSSSGVSSGSEGEEEGKWEGLLRPRYTQNVVAYHKRYYQAQPIRVVAMHWCSQDKPIYRVLNSLYYFSLDSKTQSRFKVHFGEPLELRYSLQAYGIPVDLLPLTHTMALKRQHHLQWISCRKYIEEQQEQQQQQVQQQHFQQRQVQFPQRFLQQPLGDEQTLKFFESFAASSSGVTQGHSSSHGASPPVLVECPRSYDVIIGKAKVCTNNPGNGFYSSLIEATHDEHDSLVHARDKVAMTWKILLHITEERNGRFLDWNKSLNAWVVIQDKVVIRKKIANSFKEYKRSRYVVARNNNGSHKKKHPVSASASDTKNTPAGNGGKNGVNESTSIKRRKINGCVGTACGSEGKKGTESMFAAL